MPRNHHQPASYLQFFADARGRYGRYVVYRPQNDSAYVATPDDTGLRNGLYDDDVEELLATHYDSEIPSVIRRVETGELSRSDRRFLSRYICIGLFRSPFFHDILKDDEDVTHLGTAEDIIAEQYLSALHGVSIGGELLELDVLQLFQGNLRDPLSLIRKSRMTFNENLRWVLPEYQAAPQQGEILYVQSRVDFFETLSWRLVRPDRQHFVASDIPPLPFWDWGSVPMQELHPDFEFMFALTPQTAIHVGRWAPRLFHTGEEVTGTDADRLARKYNTRIIRRAYEQNGNVFLPPRVARVNAGSASVPRWVRNINRRYDRRTHRILRPDSDSQTYLRHFKDCVICLACNHMFTPDDVANAKRNGVKYDGEMIETWRTLSHDCGRPVRSVLGSRQCWT